MRGLAISIAIIGIVLVATGLKYLVSSNPLSVYPRQLSLVSNSLDESIASAFTIKNSSDDSFKITLNASCKCTVLNQTEFVLGPKSKAEVPFYISNGNRSSDLAENKVSSSIVVSGTP